MQRNRRFPQPIDYALFAIIVACAVGILVTATRSASAETVRMSWTNATTNTDTSPIPATGPGSLVRTVVEYGTRGAGNSFGTKAGEMFVASPAATLDLNLVVVQEYALRAFHCNTYATTFALSAPGCSAASNVTFRTVAPPTPGAPQNLTSTSLTVYEIRESNGTLVASRMGLAPLGTLCGAELKVVDGVTYHSIETRDADLVNWPQALTNVRLWARCG